IVSAACKSGGGVFFAEFTRISLNNSAFSHGLIGRAGEARKTGHVPPDEGGSPLIFDALAG
ncbi:MAG: hypothetical protein LIQ31_07290, partial [Planctomycetes bacterium]|nr:hypothetical protein [Planctomycetota bacterium]